MRAVTVRRKKEPRLHHLVQRWYMKRFANSRDRIHVFDRVTKRFREDTPRNVAAERDFNTVTVADGTKETWPEEKLGDFDGEAAASTAKLLRGDALERFDRWSIAWFAALADTRGRGFREAFLREPLPEIDLSARGFLDERFVRAHAAVKGVWLDPWVLERLVLEEASRIQRGGFEIGAMVEGAFERATHFFWMQWVLATAPAGTMFITSDRPIAFVHRDGGAPGGDPLEPSTLKIVPLTPSTALVIGNIADELDLQHTVVQEGFVRLTNAALALRCDRYLIAACEAALRATVADAQLDRLEGGGGWRSRV